MNIDWKDIRPLNGSQDESFEELCAQLARTESPDGAKFERKGTPDAGVECYCILDDGSEWGWQAKYFHTMGTSQWSQLDKSVKTALDKHPALARYFVCIPLDRPDARIGRQKSAMQRWNERIEKWRGWAEERGTCVEFVWWGSSELLERLSRSEHIGRVYFWFDQRGFDSDWFQERLGEAVQAAGPRYTPEVHIDLPIAHKLEMFSRSESIFNEVKSLAKEIRRKFQTLPDPSRSENDLSQTVSSECLSELVNEVLKAFAQIEPAPVGNLPFADIAEKIASARDEVDRLEESVLQYKRDHSADKTGDDESRRYNDFRGSLYRLQHELEKVHSSLKHTDSIASSRLMLLKGEAGTGKTHLLCDFAKRRIESGTPTVLLMGQRFVARDTPWIQAPQQLDLQGVNAEKFVGALEAAAQAAGCRALLIIDALNEGEGRSIWPANLAAFLAPLEKSPWIGVLLSLRSEYEEFIIPENIRTQAVVVTHHGFDDHEYDATKTFFSHYGIEFPSAPILQPEFRNPLFLKTICLGLKNSGQRRLPRGFHGITAVFDLFLQAINKRLADSLGFNPKDALVRVALEKIAEHLIKTGKRWLDRPRAETIVNELLPGREFERSLYRGLVVEGVLTEGIDWRTDNPRSEIVNISYERFADHIIADSLLRTNLDTNTPQSAFEENGALSFICDSDKDVPPGLIEALCVQVPEKVGQELVTLAPILLNRWDIGKAFWQSIIWRKPDAFSETTREVFNQLVQKWDDIYDALEGLLTIAILEGHPFNAEFLDERLRQDSMPDRDAWWSICLHHAWDEPSAVKRLIDWTSAVTEDDDLEDKTVELCSITLAWMLTTSQRFLRDRATKALVSLLTGRLNEATRLVAHFSDVDDLYVTERVYAVAYGVAMRSHDAIGVGELALTVYEKVFAGGIPPVHILLRDYARGVIERAIYLGSDVNIDERLIRPPYKSTWPKVPNEEDIHSLMSDGSQESDDGKGVDRGKTEIRFSVMHGGDFERYVIGTNSGHTNWLSLRLDEEPWQSSDARVKALLPRLNSEQRLAWKEYKKAEESMNSLPLLSLRIDKLAGMAVDEQVEQLEKKLKNELESALGKLRSTLTAEHLAEVNDILQARSQAFDGLPRFDLNLIQRYVFWRVFDLGWTTERFGNFDKTQMSYDRKASKPERIGKKYQWIAYHEILAYIADHYQYRKEFLEDEGDQAYEGPWQESLRDIDPSCTLLSIPGGTSWGSHSPSWWAPFSYNSWAEHMNHIDWIACRDDIPSVENLLSIANPSDGILWLNVDGRFVWQQPHSADVESHDIDRREFWLTCTGYFIRTEDTDDFMKWVKGVSFEGRWMPEPPEVYGMFLGEYGWSPAFQYFNQPYHSSSTESEQGCPVPIRKAICKYKKESQGFDCSVDDSYSLWLPTHDIVEQFGLKWTGRAADYIDLEGRLAAFDPTVHEEGPSALLLREDLLKRDPSDEGLVLCWTILGGKRVRGERISSEYHGRLDISGAYTYDQELKGFLCSKYDDPHSESTS